MRLPVLLLYVVAKPVSAALDACLGEDLDTVFTKRQLAEAIDIHETQQTIDADERDILRSAMTSWSKTAQEIMTPADHVFMLPISPTFAAACV